MTSRTAPHPRGRRAAIAAAVISTAAFAIANGFGDARAATRKSPTTKVPTAKVPTASVPTNPATSQAQVLWVSPAGNDRNSGASRQQALRTVTAAWARLPQKSPLKGPVTINIAKGTYARVDTPNYWESRHGTAAAPITIRSADGPLAATFLGDMNVFDVRHLVVDGLKISSGGDAFHCERCTDVTLRSMELDGGARAAHDLLKVNQSTNFVIEDSNVHGAGDNALDFVAVQGGRITRNRIHDAGDWCAYAKGGSADIVVEGNEIFDCGTGGFTAGQGTGLEFMDAPRLTYEAERIVVRNNTIRDIEGAGLGVNGGFQITMSANRLQRVGKRSHVVEFGFGARSCDGNLPACRQRLSAGAWGNAVTANGENYVRIPNRDITFTDNSIENPAGYESQWQQFFVAGAYSGAEQAASPNNPIPARADDGLVIRGNTIRNGGPDKALGVGDDQGCQPSNATCNAAQILRDNTINR